MSDDTNMPNVAKRRNGADTLFSAEWFDDDDEFTGTKPGGLRENVSIPAGGGDAPVAEAAPAPVVEEPASGSGSRVGLIVAVLAVVFLGGGCLLGAVGAGAAFALGLVPV